MATQYRLQSNVKLSRLGRKDCPPTENKYNLFNFPIHKMEVGQSFVALDIYDYGKTIAIKHRCRRIAKNLGIKMSFAVREWRGKIKVWGVK